MRAHCFLCTALLLPSLSGCGSTAQPANPPAVKFEIRRAADKAAEGLTEVTVAVRNTTHKVYVHKEAVIDNTDIASAGVVKDKTVSADNDPEGERFAVEVELTKEGQEKLTKLTTDSVGQPLAILIDGKVVSAPVVRSTIRKKFEITGDFMRPEAERIANGITGK
jgi:preprotein translocase subunit SecD